MGTYTLEIHTAEALSNNRDRSIGRSVFGHAWLTVKNSNGVATSYGHTPNGVTEEDSLNYHSGDSGEVHSTRMVIISEEQYRAIVEMGEHPEKYGYGKGQYNLRGCTR
ncbi:hypothetical protein [Kingella potus]|uniref:hypothetical protein n=1 Tax=Kingella potus TaxID=265175 RepID=UPI0011C06CA1|nr:hypothetical protein [Kingella potus]UOO99967.1 hypothetical protein LVJ84_07980 [Kingella potus]